MVLVAGALAAPAKACDVIVGASTVQVATPTASVVVGAVPLAALAVPQAFVAEVAAGPVVVQATCARPLVRRFGVRAFGRIFGRTVIRQRTVIR